MDALKPILYPNKRFEAALTAYQPKTRGKKGWPKKAQELARSLFYDKYVKRYRGRLEDDLFDEVLDFVEKEFLKRGIDTRDPFRDLI
jgi:hypothetical protein